MKNFIASLIILLFCCVVSTDMNAQKKYGYVNSMNIVEEMPTVQTAYAKMDGIRKTFTRRGEDLVKQYQAEYQAFMKKVQEGGYSKVTQQMAQ